MASKRELERRIEKLEDQLRLNIRGDIFGGRWGDYPRLTIRGRVATIEKHLGINVRLQDTQTIPAKIVVDKVAAKKAPAKKAAKEAHSKLHKSKD